MTFSLVVPALLKIGTSVLKNVLYRTKSNKI